MELTPDGDADEGGEKQGASLRDQSLETGSIPEARCGQSAGNFCGERDGIPSATSLYAIKDTSTEYGVRSTVVGVSSILRAGFILLRKVLIKHSADGKPSLVRSNDSSGRHDQASLDTGRVHRPAAMRYRQGKHHMSVDN